jgi:EAL domain-containing protein (putative c-di-GMP-specific phosphodiesterase class I)
LGCDSLQGYLLGHPMPADRFMQDIVRGEALAKV